MNNSRSIRIHVLGDDTISPHALIYAESRFLGALTALAGTEALRHAGVILRRAKFGGPSRITCIVTVALGGASAMRIQATDDHPYAAVNRAIDGLRRESALRLERVALESGRP